MKLVLHKLINDMTNQEYHSTPNTFSSSQFKDANEDMEIFVKKHVKKEIAREENEVFDVGTYFHTMTLEPTKLKEDCVVYPKAVRRGEHWENFKAKHRGKAIVTVSQKQQAEGLHKALMSCPKVDEWLDGMPEVSLFTEINVHEGTIYAPHYGKKLGPSGWVSGPFKRIPDAFKMIVKVRADILGPDRISDLKSTTGNAKKDAAMAVKIEHYKYELSAALYLDMFSLLLPKIQGFAWIFASKDYGNAKRHWATQKLIKAGRGMYAEAMIKVADCAQNDWQIIEEDGFIYPSINQMRWVKDEEVRDIDLI